MDVCAPEIEAIQQNLPPEQRLLHYHCNNAETMAKLKRWMEPKLSGKQVEPNCGLAHRYGPNFCRAEFNPFTCALICQIDKGKRPGITSSGGIASKYASTSPSPTASTAGPKMYCQTIQSYGKSEHMNTLATLLSSRTRAEFFRLLFGVSPCSFHLREIQRHSGLSLGAIQQESVTLQKLGLITVRKDGNRTCFEPNRKHPLYEDIRHLVLKTTGLTDILREALRDSDIKCAFVFGSVARGEETAESDIDLMVIGNGGLRKAVTLLSGVAEKLGREINPHMLSEAEFARRLTKGEHLISRIMASPKIMIAGTEDDLKAMGG